MKCKICGSYSSNHNCVVINNIKRKMRSLRNYISDDMIRDYINNTHYDDVKISMNKLYIENIISGRHHYNNDNRTIPK